MHEYYAYEGACLYPFGAGCRLPKEAVPVEHPFSPLVILFARGGRVGRGIFAIQSEAELFEPEVPSVLLQPVSMSQALPCLPEPLLCDCVTGASCFYCFLDSFSDQKLVIVVFADLRRHQLYVVFGCQQTGDSLCCFCAFIIVVKTDIDFLDLWVSG